MFIKEKLYKKIFRVCYHQNRYKEHIMLTVLGFDDIDYWNHLK